MSASTLPARYRVTTLLIGGAYLAVGLWEFWLSGMFRLILFGLVTLLFAELGHWQHRKVLRKSHGARD